ncbi:unnamed protein product [Mesocestoides corti]|uniref:LEM domain-containing protein n=1 Tax=Mesocestoides corti TaxID=53468 RepID=A0A0R3UEC8_MESCO|nr:unnamed protein product [Mesocestoides corti]
MDPINVYRIFDPRHINRFRTDDLEAILILHGFYPSRDEIQQAKEKYGPKITRTQLEDEVSRYRKKPPIDVDAHLDEIKELLKVELGHFRRENLVNLFASQKVPIPEEKVNVLLKGICNKGIIELRSRLLTTFPFSTD